MHRAIIAALAATVAFTAAPANAAVVNLLQNGSFESNLDGWTVTSTGQGERGYQAPSIGTYGQATANHPNVRVSDSKLNPGLNAAGTKFLYLNSDVGVSTISQLVSLKAGTSYTFGFDYLLPGNGIGNPNGATLTATLAGQEFAKFAALNTSTADVWDFASGARTFTAAQTGNFEFSFAANGFTAKDFAVDRVFLAETASVAAVPEPATWAMMLVGFGMVGGVSRYRRRAVSAAIA